MATPPDDTELASPDLLEAVLAGAPLGMGFLDTSLRFVRVNEALAAGNGASREDHLGRRIDEVWPGIPADLLEGLARVVADGATVEGYEVTTGDGERMRHTVSTYYPVRGASGDVVGVGISVADSTDRLHTREALLALQHRLGDMLERMRVIAANLDREGRVTWCNPFLSEITGYGREEIVGRLWWDRFSQAELREAERQHFLSRLDSEGVVPERVEGYVLTRDGSRRTISWDNTVIRDPRGRVEGAACIGHDVTERVVLEQGLRALAAEQAALRRVATLVAADAPPDQVFQAVTEEAGQVLGVAGAAMLCYEPSGS